jgi:hypothetical protein
MDLKRGIDAAVEAVLAEIKRNATPTKDKEQIAQVATISANGDARSATSSPRPWRRSARRASSRSKRTSA